MKTLLKNSIYTLYPKNTLAAWDIQMGYIFHTEEIFDVTIFEKLLAFCKEYKNLTGALAICTVIPPTNARVVAGMEQHKVSNEEFLKRVRVLEEVATLGYHGHFYFYDQIDYYNAIHANSFDLNEMMPQLMRDLKWFEENKINHNGIYAGGWWFMNKPLLSHLASNGFNTDYTFSQAPFFYSQFCMRVMKENNIAPGEPMRIITSGNDEMLCIQNFIGAHDTPHVLDFDRNMKPILSESYRSPIGVINSHDYDLYLDHTLACIGHLIKNADVKFISHDKLVEISLSMTSKHIKLEHEVY